MNYRKRKWFSKTVVMLLLLMWAGGCAQDRASGEYAGDVPIATSAFCTLAVKNDNSLWFWGVYPDEFEVLNPQKVADDIETVIAHFDEDSPSLLLKTNGELYKVVHLEDIDSAPKIMADVRQITAGYNHYMILKTDGTLWTYGDNDYGQLGNGGTGDDLKYYPEPIKIMGNVRYIAAGGASSFAITTDNTLWGWGSNEFGQIGDGTTENVLKPKKIMNNVVTVSSGSEQTLAVKQDSGLWGWGWGVSGPYGDFTESPVFIMADVRFASANYGGNMAVKTDNSLWAWGAYQPKSVDEPLTAEIRDNEPMRIMSDVVYATTGVFKSFVVKSDGSLWAWGFNEYGQLGDGTRETRMEPVKIMDGLRLPAVGVMP